MGIYDAGPDWRGYLKYLAVAALFLLNAYLLLPSADYQLNVSADSSTVHPGDSFILWLEIHNNSSSPLTGSYVVVDSRSEYLEINNAKLSVPDIPPGGKATLPVLVRVGSDATFGDHLLRIFFSYPGRTEITYFKVRVG